MPDLRHAARARHRGPQAQRERFFIERQIADCRSKEEIKNALVAQFGESVLALPGDNGEGDLEDVLAMSSRRWGSCSRSAASDSR